MKKVSFPCKIICCVYRPYIFVSLSPEKEDNTRKEVPYPCTIICRLPMNLSGEALDPVSPLPNASATHQLDLKRNKFQTNPIHPYPFVLLFNSKKSNWKEQRRSKVCFKVNTARWMSMSWKAGGKILQGNSYLSPDAHGPWVTAKPKQN